jgi:DNA-3-methyladenine glycosylase II
MGMHKAAAHLKKVDPILFGAIQDTKWQTLGRDADLFAGLCRIVCGQQVSTKAAAAIYKRFESLFTKNTPTPKKVLALTEGELRSAGLSRSKALSIRDIALRVTEGSIDLKRIDALPDEEVKEMLVAARGIGPWSAEMFLIFHLGREDVFSVGDYGLLVAIMRLYKKRKLPTREAAEKLAKKWSPYRSYACRILWESLDNTPT